MAVTYKQYFFRFFFHCWTLKFCMNINYDELFTRFVFHNCADTWRSGHLD